VTQPPDGSRPTPDDPAGDPEPTPSDDQPTVPWAPPADDQPTVTWEPPTGSAATGPIISASPTGVASAAPPTPGVTGPAVSGWVMPDVGTPPAPVAGFVVAGVGARLVGILFDWLLLTILTVTISLLIMIGVGSAFTDDSVASVALLGVVFTGLEFLYFVGFWTSSRRATPGMRALGLAVVTPVDGSRISITSAVVRWFLLTVPIANLAGLLPRGSETISALTTLWWLALLVTSAAHPARRGLHDRWSGTLVIRRATASSAGVAIGGVMLIVIVVVASVVGLIFLGAQMEAILSEAGQPI
jgi:uncharacterized RDD family membrane protein YckC